MDDQSLVRDVTWAWWMENLPFFKETSCSEIAMIGDIQWVIVGSSNKYNLFESSLSSSYRILWTNISEHLSHNSMKYLGLGQS